MELRAYKLNVKSHFYSKRRRNFVALPNDLTEIVQCDGCNKETEENYRPNFSHEILPLTIKNLCLECAKKQVEHLNNL